ncbi:MAG: class I SAM-dependent methyltransferase [Bdellovibrionota bacterium]
MYWTIPWPSWLAWMLENPYMTFVSNSNKIVDKLQLEPGMVVADLGCGAGRISVPTALKLGEHGHVFALDMQEKMLRKLEKRARKHRVQNISIHHGKIRPQLLIPQHYDRIVMVTVLGEIPQKDLVIAEAAKALKEGGILSITEVIPDPCYQTIQSVKSRCERYGLHEHRLWKSPLAYTCNFKKSAKKL